MSKSWLVNVAGTIVLTTLLSACGKSSSPTGTTVTPSPPNGDDDTPTTPVTIEGIAMPSSVSVVTATNAS
jgi:hypothetical protein